MSKRKVKLRKDLNADALFSHVRAGFETIVDPRTGDIKIPLADTLMSGFAMFSLKDSSLLTFEERKSGDTNLKAVYKISTVPIVMPRCARFWMEWIPTIYAPYLRIFSVNGSGGKVLEKMVFMGGCYLLSIDGTGYFSSSTVHCDQCSMKTNSKTGEITYYHQMLCAAIVHPDLGKVIPLAPEPIIKQDMVK